MAWLVTILTVVLVLDCLLLVLLVLIQLPKKEAGLGTAFGAGATDALFGAGTGNALTKMTKYGTVVFFLLTLTLSMLRAHQVRSEQTRFSKEITKAQAEQPAFPPVPAMATNATAFPATNAQTPSAGATNNTPLPITAPPATNGAAEPPQENPAPAPEN